MALAVMSSVGDSQRTVEVMDEVVRDEEVRVASEKEVERKEGAGHLLELSM